MVKVKKDIALIEDRFSPIISKGGIEDTKLNVLSRMAVQEMKKGED